MGVCCVTDKNTSQCEKLAPPLLSRGVIFKKDYFGEKFMNNSVSPSAGRWRKFDLTKSHSGYLSVTFSDGPAVGSILRQISRTACSFPRAFPPPWVQASGLQRADRFLHMCVRVTASACGAVLGRSPRPVAEGAEQEPSLPTEVLQLLGCPVPAFGLGSVRFMVGLAALKDLFPPKWFYTWTFWPAPSCFCPVSLRKGV